MRSVHCACANPSHSFNCTYTVRTPVPARVSTPRSGHLSDESRPGTPPIGTEHAKSLSSHTTPGVRGLPEVLRRGVVESQDSKPPSSDFGLDDLFRVADLIDNKTLEDAAGTNTVFAKNMTLVLFLSRLMILGYCLKVPGSRRTFSTARWGLLQVCPNTFKVMFVYLCMKPCDLTTAHTVPVSDLASIVRKEFESV
ncbi:hypothetical protein KI688_003221 [Linnemannia hyalina]|uniref:Uncharacterized protein n=1 Tax=Linnemannia hyalina TaxID=64524 RepID=A0A9P7XP02_9FUNG|nr:hypothetical protein KI688_003221 [Linnemannia hyalina]